MSQHDDDIEEVEYGPAEDDAVQDVSLRLPVFHSAQVEGWPGEHTPEVAYVDAGEALASTYPSDAHTAAYSVPEVPHRLTLDGLGLLAATEGWRMVLLHVDVDPPRKGEKPVDEAGRVELAAARAAWWADERTKIATLEALHPGAFVYLSRSGGYHLVWRLPAPVVIRTNDDKNAWRHRYQRELLYLARVAGIVADPRCADITRLFRLPRATPDGARASLEPETIGDPHALGLWTHEPTADEVPDDLAIARSLSETDPMAWGSVARRLEPPRPAVDTAPSRGTMRGDDTDETRVFKRAESYLASMAPSIEGSGGDAALWAAALAMVRGFALGPDTGAALLWQHFNPRCQPPWPRDTIERKCREAADKGEMPWGHFRDAEGGEAGLKNKPSERRASATPLQSLVSSAVDRQRSEAKEKGETFSMRSFEAKHGIANGTVADIINGKRSTVAATTLPKLAQATGVDESALVEAMNAPAPEATEPEPEAPARALAPRVIAPHWVWAADLDWPDEKPPRRKCLLLRPAEGDEPTGEAHDFLPLGKVGMLVAAGGAGKTMALVQLAVSVVTGEPWLGYYEVPVEARGPVVLALAEEDAEEARRRLWAVREHMKMSGETWREKVLRQLIILPLAGTGVALVSTDRQTRETQHTAVLDELRQQLDTSGVDWRLVVMDPLSRWAGAETEVDNNAATRFVAALETLTKVRGNPTVLVAHHSNKGARNGTGPNDATASRGASGLTDGVRWVATLGPHSSIEKAPAISLVKSNYGPPAETRALERGDGGVLTAIGPDEEKERLMRQAESKDSGKRPEGKATTKGGGVRSTRKPTTEIPATNGSESDDVFD